MDFGCHESIFYLMFNLILKLECVNSKFIGFTQYPNTLVRGKENPLILNSKMLITANFYVTLDKETFLAVICIL